MKLRREKYLTACAVLAIMALVAGPLAAAQADQAAGTAVTVPSPHAGMMLQRLTVKLNLTEEQQASVKQLGADLQTKLQPLHQAQKQLHAQLKAALAAPTPDAATVGQAVIAMHQNGAQMKPLMQAYHQQLEALLNPDQLATYKSMVAGHSSHRHFKGGNNPTQ